MSERSQGPEGAIATVEWLHSCFGDLRYEIERIIAEGDMAAAYVTMSGTHEGGLPPGLPATHQQSVKHVHLIRCADDGRAVEHCARRSRHRHAGGAAPGAELSGSGDRARTGAHGAIARRLESFT